MALLSERNKQYLPPLFDRLTSQGTCLLDEEGIKQSIQQELSWLFNTRYSLQPYIRAITGDDLSALEERPRPISYGLDDFSSQEANNPQELCERLTELTQLFEPRIKNPKVSLKHISESKRCCWVSLTGELLLGQRTIQINFPIALTPSAGSERI